VATLPGRWSVTAVLALFLAPLSAVPADDPPPPPTPPSTTIPSRPLRDSVERVVGKVEEDRKAPCRKVADGVPCFSTSIEVGPPEVTTSVRDSLRDLGPPGRASAPTIEEMKAFRPGPLSQVFPLVSFDPGCVGKSALKWLKGRNDTYYLYRVRDVRGERVALYDHRLEAATFQGSLEFLGKFDGECEALAAYRREDRKTGTPQPLPSK
jgi:hypothetical protein